MNSYRIFLQAFFLLNIFAVQAFSQNQLSRGSFDKAECRLLIESVLEKGDLPDLSNEDLEKLGDCYTLRKKYSSAEAVYAELLSRENPAAEYNFKYAEVLFAAEKFDAAKIYYQRSLQKRPENNYLKLRIKSCDSISAWADNEPNDDYELQVRILNEADIEQVLKEDKLQQANLLFMPGIRDTSAVSDSLKIWKNKPWLLSDYWCSSLTYVPEHNLMAYSLRKKYQNRNGLSYGNSQIMFDSPSNTEIDSMVIFRPKGVPEDVNIAHPTFARGGKRIYFASDMPGSLGGTDIWYSEINDGTWSQAVNLGEKINTGFDELSPAVKGDSLFFASAGHPGYGNLDIFYALLAGDSLSNPVNLKAPVNSAANDLLYKAYTTDFAVFSSDRDSTRKALLDLYSAVRVYYEKTDDDRISEPKEEYVFNVNDYHLPVLFFEYDKARILPQYRAELNRMADTLRKYDHIKAEIFAFTDSRGSKNRNESLSQRRADSVFAYLAKKGVPESQIIAKGQGTSNDNTYPSLQYHVFVGTSTEENKNDWYEKKFDNKYKVNSFPNGKFYSYYIGTFNNLSAAEEHTKELQSGYKGEYLIGASHKGVFLPNYQYYINRRAEFELKEK